MRKTLIALGLAFTLGAAGTIAGAQSTTERQGDRRPRRERVAQNGEQRGGADRDGGRRGRGGPGGGLLRGITLTDAQKEQLRAERERREPQAKAQREQFDAIRRDERAARERGDSAGVKAARDRAQQLRTQLEPQRQQQIAALRAILTPEQQKQLDANLAKGEGKGRGKGR